MGVLKETAPAKVNLTLRVLARRDDGFHDIESFTAFARVGDELELEPGPALSLTVRGPGAEAVGDSADNLVLRAARALARHVPGLTTGHFTLTKNLPVAAGLGGGSSDAAAALRLLARANGIAPDDSRLFAAAAATGSDVPVCLDPRARIMQGRGERLGPPLALPVLPCVLVNPGVAVPTAEVFAALGLQPGMPGPGAGQGSFAAETGDWLAALRASDNDLAAPARRLAPVIGEVEQALAETEGVELVRMSGSGATVFGLYRDGRTAHEAARRLKAQHPGWWIATTELA